MRTSRGLNGENQVFEKKGALLYRKAEPGRVSQWLKVESFTLRTAHSRYLLKNFNMTPNRLSSHISTFGLVVFVLKPFLGNARQW